MDWERGGQVAESMAHRDKHEEHQKRERVEKFAVQGSQGS